MNTDVQRSIVESMDINDAASPELASFLERMREDEAAMLIISERITSFFAQTMENAS